MMPFNKPPIIGTEHKYIQEAMASGKLCGDGSFSQRCENWLSKQFLAKKALLTPSCTASLEMAALLLNIQIGDEVIMPSYTFVSTANAFALRGAKVIFVDVRPDTMNIDEKRIEAAITSKTKAIVPVHYAGVSCEMNAILALAEHYHLAVVEDAAQGVMATYEGSPLGTIGQIGCYSFHETKNYTAGGEGGAIMVNESQLIEIAEIIREKGTDRSQFFRGQVDKYTWRSLGSSYLMSDLQAAYLYAQLIDAEKINRQRLSIWEQYNQEFASFYNQERVTLPTIPNNCGHNAHMFYLKLHDLEDRNDFIQHLKSRDILSVFHYIPLHSSPAGKILGRFSGKDQFTTAESERLVRLPLFYNMKQDELDKVIQVASDYLAK